MNKPPLKFLALLCLLTLLLAIGACGKNESGKSQVENKPAAVKIGIVYTEPHPVLTTIAEAFKAEVLKHIPDATFIEKHASGSKAQYPSTVRAVLTEGVALIAPITTPMSIEALRQAEGSVPVVFLGVTDPVGAELVNSLETPGRCTGVSDNPPMAGVIALVKQFNPEAKSVGIPYDPKDQPGVTTANRAAEYATASGLEAKLRPVPTETELRAAVRGLASEVDAVVIGMDNLMMKNAGIISRTILDQHKPLFAADDKSVEMGAVAGVGVDYADVGRLGGEIAAMILVDHQAAGNIPVKSLETGQVFYNAQMADQLGLTIPDSIKNEGRAATPTEAQQ